MLKSATERFQIKKKRKHNQQKNKILINKTYLNKKIAISEIAAATTTVSALSSTATTITTAIKNQQRRQQQSKKNAATVQIAANLEEKEILNKFQYKNYFSLSSLLPTTILGEDCDCITDDCCVCDCDLKCECRFDCECDVPKVKRNEKNNNCNSNNNNSSSSSGGSNCCLRDQQHVANSIAAAAKSIMPLSQGFNAKGALATKRAHKTTKVYNNRDEAKRKPSENLWYDNHSKSNNNSSNSNSNSNNNNLYAYVIPQKRTINQLQQQLYNNGSNLKSQSNAEFSFLIAESLASFGQLQEAFDIYACIAREQCVPLQRLNKLANCLIVYMRRLSYKQNENIALTANSKLQANNLKSENDFDCALLTNSKSKYSRQQQQQRTWSHSYVNSSSTDSTHPTGNILGMNLSLHAPSRELRVPSPEMADDYDPLLCPLCRDILRCPVTTNCGHTFCRQCCETITMCNICQIKFPRTSLDDFVADTNAIRHYNSEQLFNLNSPRTYSRPTATTSTTNSGNITSFYNTNPNTNGSIVGDNSNNALCIVSTRNSLNYSTSGTTTTAITTMPQTTRLCLSTTSPITVTTTTVASTTATATTTMASTSAASATTTIGGNNKHSGISSNMAVDSLKFMPDVQVQRLVEKWWGADVQAKKINETAASYMHSNRLDEALKNCNASLEKSPTNFKSLLLRAEVLRKLNHFQSSLADVENALKIRYTSAKAHYLRALALSELGRFDEALYDNCLAISLDKAASLTTTELFQHDLSKTLQKFLAQSQRSKFASHRCFSSTSPYSVLTEQRLRRKQMALLRNSNEDHINVMDEDFIACSKKCDIMADEEVVLAAADYHSTYPSIGKDYDVSMRRHPMRKHFRRKWMPKETELLPTVPLDELRCSTQFYNIIERTQQELQRLRKLESSSSQLGNQLMQVPANLIDASDFDCVLCCRTLWKPVVTPCGHTYCRVCLDRCMDYTSSCPLCMSPLVEPNVNQLYQGASSPVPLILAKRPVTKFLEAAMKRFIPDSYEKRSRQERNMEPSVPVFICTTAFPNVACPLFVYEPRYRLMVRRAVESGEKQFGIVHPHKGKSRYYDVGTILDIRDCVMLRDGCSILSTVGCKRFKILTRNEKDGYETAKVEYIYDETITDENVKFVSAMHASVRAKAIAWFESLGTEFKQEILQSFGEMPAVEDNWESIADGPAWAWWIIALLPLNPQLKVNILATTSLEKRLRAIEKTLDYIAVTLRRSQQDCDVVVVQQQQHQQQQHQHQQQQQQQHQCENALTHACQNDECFQRTANATGGVVESARDAATLGATAAVLSPRTDTHNHDSTNKELQQN